MQNPDDENSIVFDFERDLDDLARGSSAPTASAAATAASRGRNYRQVVCRHWLRGLCMMGDDCGFLHQLDMDRMPVCRFFSEGGNCRSVDCLFKHIRPAECHMYNMGSCPNGLRCRYKHVKIPGTPPPPADQIRSNRYDQTLNTSHAPPPQQQQNSEGQAAPSGSSNSNTSSIIATPLPQGKNRFVGGF